MTIWTVVRFQQPMFHRWKDAPEIVSFLRNIHRHMAFVEVWVEEKHNERDIEFIQFKRGLEDHWKLAFHYSVEDSCEIIANRIKLFVEYMYSGRKVRVGVFEDNENGGFVE